MKEKLAEMYEHLMNSLGYCMRSVVKSSRDGKVINVESKSDGSIVTPADKQSEAAGKQILRMIEGVQIHGEETGTEGNDSDLIVFLDPLDGSMPYALGANTSTVIIAVYSKSLKQVVWCAVGNPFTGDIWVAETGEKTQYMCVQNGSQVVAPMYVSVCSGGLSFKGRIFIDSYPSFTRGGREILSTKQLNGLHSLIQSKAGLMMLGTNGFHHALVANGGAGALGAITTAIGGPWDVCPVLLVLQAGGFAQAYSVNEDGCLIPRNDPLDVTSYDILITANSIDTLDILCCWLRELF